MGKKKEDKTDPNVASTTPPLSSPDLEEENIDFAAWLPEIWRIDPHSPTVTETFRSKLKVRPQELLDSAICDLYLNAYYFGREEIKVNAPKMALFLGLLRSLHETVTVEQRPLAECLAWFEREVTLLATPQPLTSSPSPPSGSPPPTPAPQPPQAQAQAPPQLTLPEATAISTYVGKTYFRHIQLYRVAARMERPVQQLEPRRVHVVLPCAPPPLAQASPPADSIAPNSARNAPPAVSQEELLAAAIQSALAEHVKTVQEDLQATIAAHQTTIQSKVAVALEERAKATSAGTSRGEKTSRKKR
eukprot:gnl/Trimastix_PCT/3079.p1 GENE.gnl/Trimastix_PCT/3079~~gnl/Trimastix_PCT/3079.p1  ORF type:complete len:303 (-),score=55.92 gnl/Trimastix_PCT/3079:22-930(-)